MLTFFGDLIAKETSLRDPTGPQFSVMLFRTEAPGYVLAVDYNGGGEVVQWAAHTPRRLDVAKLFDQYVDFARPDAAALAVFKEAMLSIMAQSPELDEVIQWSSVVAKEQ
jgi:hypothetical protein